MKNYLLFVNLIFAACIAFLFYKVYQKDSTTSLPNTVSDNGIVFVNSDSLLENFDYYNSIHERLNLKRDSLDAYIEAKGKRLENEVANYQQRAAAMSPAERQKTEEELMRKQQSIMDERKHLIELFSDEEDALNDSLYNKLQDAIQKYNQTHNYTFILGYQRGGGILFANDSLDVTKDVIKVLNEN